MGRGGEVASARRPRAPRQDGDDGGVLGLAVPAGSAPAGSRRGDAQQSHLLAGAFPPAAPLSSSSAFFNFLLL